MESLRIRNAWRREPYVRVGRLESHPDGNWQVRLRQKSGDDIIFTRRDGSGMDKTEAEARLDEIDNFIAERN